MLRTTALLLALLTAAGSAAAQSAAAASQAQILATVNVTAPVLAGGKPLPMGTYELRLINERPEPNPGQSADAQRRVEFVANGMVVAREVAEVLRDNDLPTTGASTEHAAEGVRVQMLKGGEFLRISVKRDGVRYLIHLPTAP